MYDMISILNTLVMLSFFRKNIIFMSINFNVLLMNCITHFPYSLSDSNVEEPEWRGRF
jgi:hypothetical protein